MFQGLFLVIASNNIQNIQMRSLQYLLQNSSIVESIFKKL